MKENIIQIQNLTQRFEQIDALTQIDLNVYRGAIFGIIGMSGAGKSTLMRCLTGLGKPTSGQIFLGEIELVGLPEKQLRQHRKKIGMIFQHFNLFSSRTALENIAYPLEIEGVNKQKRTAKAKELLTLVGLKGKGAYYPSQLSGGEKQRVAIARALANSPQLLLCDEATSALDPRTTHSILELLESINQKLGLTILLITHEMEVIKQICTDVAVLEHGMIVEQGSTLDLFASPKHPTTKRFLQNLSHQIPDDLSSEGDLLHLCFQGESASRPIISSLIKEFDVEVNILLGGIDVLKEGLVGNLVISLSGTSEQKAKAYSFLDRQKVVWERVK
ncbi:MAG: Methionine import ATP-binding protein MetN [Chlamydiales bacterium]|nr:Methionine import ATP-binding protein MetN [Chlamydiales bacterium]